ncbi:hypothetical protein EW661_21825, partial [Escherichia coli]
TIAPTGCSASAKWPDRVAPSGRRNSRVLDMGISTVWGLKSARSGPGFPAWGDNAALNDPAMKIERIVSTRLPTPHGEFAIHGFRESDSGQEHVVLSMGELTGDEPPLVRVHSECMTGEVFGSLRCDCRPQLE